MGTLPSPPLLPSPLLNHPLTPPTPPSIHLGPAPTPSEESQPRITLEPNFYYQQEDFLSSFCTAHATSYTVAMPSYIMGAVPDAAMNLVFPLGVYASVKKHLNEELEFPSDLQSWEATHVGSSARLNAYLEEWAVLTEGARNERFNAADSSPFTWGNFWGKFAGWYGLKAGRPSLEEGVYAEVVTPYDPPPRGYVGPPLLSPLCVCVCAMKWLANGWKCLGLDRLRRTASDLRSRTGLSSPRCRKRGRN